MTTRVLILTASFGEGHNSAARGIAGGLERVAGTGVQARLHDLICEAEPLKGAWLQSGYKLAITHWPWVWRRFYNLAERVSFEDERLFFLTRVQHRLAQVMAEFSPGAVVCTFPLYPHLMAKVFGAAGAHVPVFTVVTDSITINQVWFSPVTNFYLAPDEVSAAELRRRGVGEQQIFTSGFPVDPLFAEGATLPIADQLQRVLYFPATSRRLVRRTLRALLDSTSSDVEFTFVLGRHERRLEAMVAETISRYQDRRVRCLGWRNDVPALMAEHDCVIAKAGGATVHECGAAGRPLLITQIVPGQEEGNAELVQRRGSGLCETNPEALGLLLARLRGSARWKRMCAAAWAHRRPQAALIAAKFVLDHVR